MPVAALDVRLVSARSTGDTTYWRGLVGGLARIESEFKFLLFSNTSRPPGIPDSEKFEWIEVPSPSTRLWSLQAFPKAAHRLGADVIHSQYNLSPLIGPHGVTTIHDVSFFIGPQWFKLKDRLLLQKGLPRTCRRASQVITVSETSKAEVERYIPAARGKVSAILNALSDNVVPTSQEEAERIVRGQMGITRPYAMTVGMRWPRKNMMLAVEAMEALPESLPHQLIVTGKPGWGEENFGKRTRATGYVSNQELTALYQCADLYIAPSLHEGFGIPLLEAFACGCPVLTSTGGALPEVADGAAEIEPTFDPVSWTATIARLLGDPKRRAELVEKGHKRLGDFDWGRSAEQTLDVYRKVLA
jgi:glycosyltransferase involved in cell wall biosynthesis